LSAASVSKGCAEIVNGQSGGSALDDGPIKNCQHSPVRKLALSCFSAATNVTGIAREILQTHGLSGPRLAVTPRLRDSEPRGRRFRESAQHWMQPFLV
jgi:hypothetical protein